MDDLKAAKDIVERFGKRMKCNWGKGIRNESENKNENKNENGEIYPLMKCLNDCIENMKNVESQLNGNLMFSEKLKRQIDKQDMIMKNLFVYLSEMENMNRSGKYFKGNCNQKIINASNNMRNNNRNKKNEDNNYYSGSTLQSPFNGKSNFFCSSSPIPEGKENLGDTIETNIGECNYNYNYNYNSNSNYEYFDNGCNGLKSSNYTEDYTEIYTENHNGNDIGSKNSKRNTCQHKQKQQAESAKRNYYEKTRFLTNLLYELPFIYFNFMFMLPVKVLPYIGIKIYCNVNSTEEALKKSITYKMGFKMYQHIKGAKQESARNSNNNTSFYSATAIAS
ncbi:uncharacterized protein ASCRUDRAFT_8641 [Ascoidea rubescens DSM 1968]|uniref:Uncharacterized protein n=1 Tax=Ascoidea rubescens DSM 1968 TaxID=1344418 RepID=A0A1D2VG17_9ASCO|nr:hypothetical protein ASCRUDRAFT_8641 [Ascoidea rubescens DSM 1968]ODV60417.1 hypothetical protein ASCRUDRAFT_8641 [Ascoidea rubescens DSM 1968]